MLVFFLTYKSKLFYTFISKREILSDAQRLTSFTWPEVFERGEGVWKDLLPITG
jgi:hypothetical protein